MAGRGEGGRRGGGRGGKRPFAIPLDLPQCATQFANLSVYQRRIKSANSLTQHIIKTSRSGSGIF